MATTVQLSPNRSSSQEGSGGLKVAPRVNETGRANASLATKSEFHQVLEAAPALLPPNVSGQDAPHSAEAGASPSNADCLPPVIQVRSWLDWRGRLLVLRLPRQLSSRVPLPVQPRTAFGSGTAAMTMAGSAGMHRTAVVAGVGVDVIRPPPPQAPDSRRRRGSPAQGKIVTGFHQTSPDVCKLIVNSAFRPGSDGHCGGAIYFALSPQATKTKAIGNDSKSGCMIEVKVDVGRVKYEGSRCGHKWTKQEFLQTGYDSIRFDPGDGDELVIYDSSRVKSMRIIPFNDAWRPTYNVR